MHKNKVRAIIMALSVAEGVEVLDALGTLHDGTQWNIREKDPVLRHAPTPLVVARLIQRMAAEETTLEAIRAITYRLRGQRFTVYPDLEAGSVFEACRIALQQPLVESFGTYLCTIGDHELRWVDNDWQLWRWQKVGGWQYWRRPSTQAVRNTYATLGVKVGG